METTLIILKPDAVQRGLVGRIISRFEDKGLEIAAGKFMTVSPDLAGQLYEPHRGKPFYDGLLRFMTSSPVMVLAVRGLGAIEICRRLLGETFGSRAAAGTIRGDFGVSNSYNLVHGSDSPESARRELALFFDQSELIEYERTVGIWVYDCTSGTPE